MADLKEMLSKMGLMNITTYIQSGNVVFEAQEENGISYLEDKIERAISESFDLDVPVIIRTAEEWSILNEENPFDKENVDQLHVTFLKRGPLAGDIEKVNTYNYPGDDFRMIGKHLYIQCSGKYRDSKLTNKFFEDKLKVSATTRNWKTVMKLLELSRQ